MPDFLGNLVKLLELLKEMKGLAKFLVWKPVVVANLDKPDYSQMFCLRVSKMHTSGKAVICRVFLDKVTDEMDQRRSEVGTPVELWPGPVRIFGDYTCLSPVFRVVVSSNENHLLQVTTVLKDENDNAVMGGMWIGELGQKKELRLTVRVVFFSPENIVELADKVLRIAVRPSPTSGAKYEWTLLPPEKEPGKNPRSVTRLLGYGPSEE